MFWSKRACWGLFIVGFLLAGCNEPRFMGRTLSFWVVDLQADDAYKRRAACEALGGMGPQAATAVPEIVKLLDDANEGVQEFAVDALVKIGQPAVGALEVELTRSEPHIRFHAATALVKINPQHVAGAKAMMNVFTGLGNADMAKRAQGIIVRLGGALVPRLVEAAGDSYMPVRLFAVQTLGKIREKASAALPDLIKIIQGQDDLKLRKAAMLSAANIGTKEALESVYRGLLDDPNEDLADTAGDLLRHIGVREGTTGMEGHVEEGEAAAPAEE